MKYLLKVVMSLFLMVTPQVGFAAKKIRLNETDIHVENKKVHPLHTHKKHKLNKSIKNIDLHKSFPVNNTRLDNLPEWAKQFARKKSLEPERTVSYVYQPQGLITNEGACCDAFVITQADLDAGAGVLTLTQTGNYKFARDLQGQLIVDADNVNIDMCGFTLSPKNIPSDIGVLLLPKAGEHRTGFKLTNGSIQGFISKAFKCDVQTPEEAVFDIELSNLDVSQIGLDRTIFFGTTCAIMLDANFINFDFIDYPVTFAYHNVVITKCKVSRSANWGIALNFVDNLDVSNVQVCDISTPLYFEECHGIRITASQNIAIQELQVSNISLTYPYDISPYGFFAFASGSYITQCQNVNIKDSQFSQVYAETGNIVCGLLGATCRQVLLENVQVNDIQGGSGTIVQRLAANPIATGPSGSSILTITAPDHGLLPGPFTVNIKGTVGFDGISADTINGEHSYNVIDKDTFTIDVSPAAAAVGNVAGGGYSVALTSGSGVGCATIQGIHFSDFPSLDGNSGWKFVNCKISNITTESQNPPPNFLYNHLAGIIYFGGNGVDLEGCQTVDIHTKNPNYAVFGMMFLSYPQDTPPPGSYLQNIRLNNCLIGPVLGSPSDDLQHGSVNGVFFSSVTYNQSYLRGRLSLVPLPGAEYSPVEGPDVIRIHIPNDQLPPTMQGNNTNIYYFSDQGVSNPYPSGSVNNLDLAGTNVFFLRGGVDSFGPYWDLDLAFLPSYSYTPGFLLIQKDTLEKASYDIKFFHDIVSSLLNTQGGDVFVTLNPRLASSAINNVLIENTKISNIVNTGKKYTAAIGLYTQGLYSDDLGPEFKNFVVQGCTITDCHNTNPGDVNSAGILLAGVEKPVIVDNIIGDCDTAVLFTRSLLFENRYTPYSSNGLVQRNQVEGCSLAGFSDKSTPYTSTAWVENTAFENGQTHKSNYDIRWKCKAPVSEGSLACYPSTSKKAYNLSIVKEQPCKKRK